MWIYVVGSLVVNTSTYKESEKTIQDYLESLQCHIRKKANNE